MLFDKGRLMVTYSKEICKRCEQPIKSGRVQKILGKEISYNGCYCRHCFKSVISEI